MFQSYLCARYKIFLFIFTYIFKCNAQNATESQAEVEKVTHLNKFNNHDIVAINKHDLEELLSEILEKYEKQKSPDFNNTYTNKTQICDNVFTVAKKSVNKTSSFIPVEKKSDDTVKKKETIGNETQIHQQDNSSLMLNMENPKDEVTAAPNGLNEKNMILFLNTSLVTYPPRNRGMSKYENRRNPSSNTPNNNLRPKEENNFQTSTDKRNDSSSDKTISFIPADIDTTFDKINLTDLKFKKIKSSSETEIKDDFSKNDSDINNKTLKDEKVSEGTDLYSNRRIIGGSAAGISHYQYHVGYGSNCAGAIINKNWVLTVAHCGTKAKIYSGSSRLAKGKETFVAEYFVHPGWRAANKDHPFDFDFQLLKLAKPLTFDSNTNSAKLGTAKDLTAGKLLSVTGWGNVVEKGDYSQDLRVVQVPIVRKSVCQNVNFPYFRGKLTDRMFCAGFTNGEKDACQGDSGGPAFSEGKLLGLVSFGYGCATPQSYGVYAKVSAARPWIEQVTRLQFE